MSGFCCKFIPVDGRTIRKWAVSGSVVSFATLIFLVILTAQSLVSYYFVDYLDDLISNWSTNAIAGFSLLSTCGETDKFIQYSWGGIHAGCDCTSSNGRSTTTLSPCSGSSYSTDMRSSCVSCGATQSSDSTQICLSSCPIFDLSPKLTSSAPPTGTTGTIGDILNYSISRSNSSTMPIVDVIFQVSNVCLKRSNQLNKSANNQYILLNEAIDMKYQCEVEDSRYLKIEDSLVNEIDYLINNGINTISEYPGYPLSRRPSIFVRRMIAWSSQCGKSSIDLISNFHDNISTQRQLRGILLSLVFISSIISSFLALLNLCEAGYKEKQAMCCQYQAPDCMKLALGKQSISPTITDYFSLYDPLYSLLTCGFFSSMIAASGLSIMIFYTSLKQNFAIFDIAEKNCSDVVTNKILREFSLSYQQNVWAQDQKIGIICPLFTCLIIISFVIIIRIITNHRRNWFTVKMTKRKEKMLPEEQFDKIILTSEETEVKRACIQQVYEENEKKLKDQQREIIEADQVQRVNLLNQSMQQVNNKKGEALYNQSFEYELSRISNLLDSSQDPSQNISFSGSILRDSIDNQKSIEKFLSTKCRYKSLYNSFKREKNFAPANQNITLLSDQPAAALSNQYIPLLIPRPNKKKIITSNYSSNSFVQEK